MMRLQTASYCIPHLCDTWGACRCGGILLQPCLVMMHRIECSFASAEGVSSNQRWHIAGAKSWLARRTWCNERKWSKMHNSNDRARLTNPSKVTTKTSLEFPHRAMNSKVKKSYVNPFQIELWWWKSRLQCTNGLSCFCGELVRFTRYFLDANTGTWCHVDGRWPTRRRTENRANGLRSERVCVCVSSSVPKSSSPFVADFN